MSEENTTSTDARAAAFAQRDDAKQYVEWRGHRYEVRAPTLKFQREQRASKEDETAKAIRMIIACTYWPPEAPPDEQGKARAGTPMFNTKDFDLIAGSYGDNGSLWFPIIRAAGKLMEVSSETVEEAKKNS